MFENNKLSQPLTSFPLEYSTLGKKKKKECFLIVNYYKLIWKQSYKNKSKITHNLNTQK